MVLEYSDAQEVALNYDELLRPMRDVGEVDASLGGEGKVAVSGLTRI